MFAFDWTEANAGDSRRGWTCGYISGRNWEKTSDDKQILIRSNCEFPYSTDNDGTDAPSFEKSFDSCQNICLNDRRCNAFSFHTIHERCFIPYKSLEFTETSLSLLNFAELFRRRNTKNVMVFSKCGVIPIRNWKIDLLYLKGNDEKIAASYNKKIAILTLDSTSLKSISKTLDKWVSKIALFTALT